MSSIAYPSLTISVERDEIEMPMLSQGKEPDPNWRYLDKAGHLHAWVKGDELPSTRKVSTGVTWVGDDHDGSEVEIFERLCLVCGEVINPGYRPAAAKPLLGPWRYKVTVSSSNGTYEGELDEREYDRLLQRLGIEMTKVCLNTRFTSR